MVAQIKWVDMVFDLDIPVGKYPALLERLAGTPVRLEEKIRNTPFLVLTQSLDNGWSIQEHVGHLLDLEELAIQRLNDFEAWKEVLTAADMSNRKTYDARHNDHDINTLLKAFRSTRNSIVKRLQMYDETMLCRTALHPRLQRPMRIPDMANFIAEHDDHHLAAITLLEKALTC